MVMRSSESMWARDKTGCNSGLKDKSACRRIDKGTWIVQGLVEDV